MKLAPFHSVAYCSAECSAAVAFTPVLFASHPPSGSLKRQRPWTIHPLQAGYLVHTVHMALHKHHIVRLTLPTTDLKFTSQRCTRPQYSTPPLLGPTRNIWQFIIEVEGLMLMLRWYGWGKYGVKCEMFTWCRRGSSDNSAVLWINVSSQMLMLRRWWAWLGTSATAAEWLEINSLLTLMVP